MAVSPFNLAIPNVKVPVLGADGSLTLPWRRYLQTLPSAGSTVSPADLAALEALVTTLTAEVGVLSIDATSAIATANQALTDAQDALGLVASLLDQASGGVTTSPAGFGFFAGGLIQSGELLGTAVWGNPRLFIGTSQDVARSLWPASLNSTITLNAYTGGGSRYVAGTVNFNHAATGTVAWSPSLNLAPGAALEVNGPVPFDPTLASVRVMAYSS